MDEGSVVSKGYLVGGGVINVKSLQARPFAVKRPLGGLSRMEMSVCDES